MRRAARRVRNLVGVRLVIVLCSQWMTSEITIKNGK
jgi:hypothetical protein